MPLKCYLARPHLHRSEELAARTFIHELKQLLSEDDSASLVCNVQVYQSQIDAVLFTAHAVTVLDWKAIVGERLAGSERGAWLRDGEPVLAGTHENPYQQLTAIRRTLAGYFQKNAAELFQDHGQRFDTRLYFQISAALVCVPTQLKNELSLPNSSRSWFLVTGLDLAARAITAFRSPLHFTPEEVQVIVEGAWHCPRWTGLEALLPNRAVGVLRYVRPDGTRHSREVLRTFSVGRGADSDFVLPAPSPQALDLVSRRHVQLQATGGETLLYDLGSTRGTYLNGARLTPGEPYPVKHGDQIWLGGPPRTTGAAQLEYWAQVEVGDDRTTAAPAP